MSEHGMQMTRSGELMHVVDMIVAMEWATWERDDWGGDERPTGPGRERRRMQVRDQCIAYGRAMGIGFEDAVGRVYRMWERTRGEDAE